MNRNFLKISVSIVALVLALAFCLTGCKVDDVADDLSKVRDEVSTNKTEAAKNLDDAVKALEAKVSANNANCTAEIANLTKAIDAAKAAGETNLAAAEEALSEAIDVIRTDLEAAKKELGDKITANDTKLNEEIGKLSAAIENALAACELADLASLATLASTVAECQATLEAAIEAVASDVEALTEYVKSVEKTLGDKIAAGEKNLTANVAELQSAIEKAVANSDKADADLKAELEQAIADATKKIIEAVDIIKDDLQEKIDAIGNNANVSDADIASLKEALGNVEVEKDENGVITNDVASQLKALNKVVEDYEAATDAVIEAWHEIKLTYQVWNECVKSYGDTYVLDENGEKVAVDLEKAYNTTQVRLYRALSVEEVNEIKNEFFKVIEDVRSDNIDALNAIYEQLLGVEAELDKVTPNLTEVGETLDAVELSLAEYEEANLIVAGKVVDLHKMYDELRAKYNALGKEDVADALDRILAGINAAETLEDLVDVKTALDEQTAIVAELAAEGADVAELSEKCETVLAAYYAKYVDLYAAELTARMNAYIDNLGAIYTEVKSDATVNNIEAIRNDFVALTDAREYREALNNNSAAVNALYEAEAKFAVVEEQYVALAALVEKAADVAAILNSEEFEEVTGTKSEFVKIKEYRDTAAAWVAELDELYAAFTADKNAEAYEAVKACINEARFNEINNAFEASIAELIKAADAVVAAVDALKAEVENGYALTTGEAVTNAWTAVWAWMGLATDADGVGYIIDWKSNGELTHENLVSAVNAIDLEYKAFLAEAQADWNVAYTTPGVADITVESLTVYENRLTAVRAWFDKYGVVSAEYVEANDLGDIGTSEINEQVKVLEEALAALIAKAAEEATALQNRIDNLGTITTDSKETVETLRADYNAWLEANGIEVDNAQNEALGLVVDTTALLEAETKLAELNKLALEIKSAIADLDTPVLGDDLANPYFESADAKSLYLSNVDVIVKKLAQFKNANGNDYRGCFTAEELKKIDDCKLYGDKYDALVEVYNAYETVAPTVTDEVISAKLVNYLNEARGQVDSYDSTTANVSAVIASIGKGALAQFEDIASGKI